MNMRVREMCQDKEVDFISFKLQRSMTGKESELCMCIATKLFICISSTHNRRIRTVFMCQRYIYICIYNIRTLYMYQNYVYELELLELCTSIRTLKMYCINIVK